MKKLEISQAEKLRKKFIPSWEIRKGKYLYKKIALDDYSEVLKFLAVIEKPQIELDHFADFKNFYNQLTIGITTHDIGGLTKLDFDLALYIEEAIKLMGARTLEEMTSAGAVATVATNLGGMVRRQPKNPNGTAKNALDQDNLLGRRANNKKRSQR